MNQTTKTINQDIGCGYQVSIIENPYPITFGMVVDGCKVYLINVGPHWCRSSDTDHSTFRERVLAYKHGRWSPALSQVNNLRLLSLVLQNRFQSTYLHWCQFAAISTNLHANFLLHLYFLEETVSIS